MVSDKTYENALRDIHRLEKKLKDSDKINIKLMSIEMELSAKNDKLISQNAELMKRIDGLAKIMHDIDNARKRTVIEKRKLEQENEKLRRMISDLTVSDKLNEICEKCSWCEDDGVSCGCPDECFFSASEDD